VAGQNAEPGETVYGKDASLPASRNIIHYTPKKGEKWLARASTQVACILGRANGKGPAFLKIPLEQFDETARKKS